MSKGIITVVGSYVVDLMSRTPHMPKAGETVLGGPFRMGPGGKGGNQAVAAARQGSQVYMVTKVGNDSFGQSAIENFKHENIRIPYVYTDQEEPTGVALIIVDPAGENIIVVASGACGKLTAENVSQAQEAIKNSSIVLVQLEIQLEAVEQAIAIANLYQVPVILNPAPYREIPSRLLKQITYITPNETEASLLSGIEVKDEQSALSAAKRIHEMGVPRVLITMGKQGCFFFDGKAGKLFPGFRVETIDTTGAGDAFNGGLAHALAKGYDLQESIKYANAVGALSTMKVGTAPAMPTKEVVLDFLQTAKGEDRK